MLHEMLPFSSFRVVPVWPRVLPWVLPRILESMCVLVVLSFPVVSDFNLPPLLPLLFLRSLPPLPLPSSLPPLLSLQPFRGANTHDCSVLSGHSCSAVLSSSLHCLPAPPFLPLPFVFLSARSCQLAWETRYVLQVFHAPRLLPRSGARLLHVAAGTS